ncbi:MAG: Uma2 family endonuclease [Candidatus Binatia bacterium]
MAQVSGRTELTAPLRIRVRRTKFSEDQLMELCQENPELRLELTAQGELIIMPPVGAEDGWRSGEVFYFLTAWTNLPRRNPRRSCRTEGRPCPARIPPTRS